MNPRIQDVSPEAGFRLKLTFTNGETGLFDCSGMLDTGISRELRDEAYFRQARVEAGTVVWSHEQGICQYTLYEDSVRQSR